MSATDRPSLDPDYIDDLGDRIVVAGAHIEAATQQQLLMIAEFDSLRGWAHHGCRDCAEWLAARCGIDHATAQEKVRVARALPALPLTSQALGRGELTYAKVRALTRVAKPENEKDLVELGLGVSAARLETMCRAYRKNGRKDDLARERERVESRTLSVFPDDDGMYFVKGRLTPEVAAVLMRAIDAASDALFREKPNPLESEEERRRHARQRRADAIGLLAERALAAGFGDESAISGSRADRYTVVLHVDADTLSPEGEPGHSEFPDGTRLSAESAQRVACDAAVVEVAHRPDGSVLDVGRKKRTVPPALRRALEVRDCGCRFPGCGARFTDAHHVKHWAHGGKTSLDNTILLCRHHHALVHEGGWRMGLDADRRAVFIDPRGHLVYDGRFQPPELPKDVLAAMIAEHAAHGIEPDGWTPSVRWTRERDIPDEIYFGATAAM
jgi:hypothetical protein